MENNSKKLADEHWAYIEGLLKAHGADEYIETIEYHYKTAFIHGYKHAIEDMENKYKKKPLILYQGLNLYSPYLKSHQGGDIKSIIKKLQVASQKSLDLYKKL